MKIASPTNGLERDAFSTEVNRTGKGKDPSLHDIMSLLLQRHAKHNEPNNDAYERRVHGMEAHLWPPLTVVPPRESPHDKIAERAPSQLAQDGTYQGSNVDEVDVWRGEVVVAPEEDGDDGADPDGPRKCPREPEGREPAGWVPEHDELGTGTHEWVFQYGK